MKSKLLYLYYLVLILILVFYTNMSGSPNSIIRLGYLAALVLPLLDNLAMYPAIIICTLGISKNTFAYPFMPTEMIYYVMLTLVFAFISVSKHKTKSSINSLFILILLYVALNDLILQYHFSLLATVLFIVTLFYFCTEEHLETSVKFLPYTFIILSLAICYWRFFCPEAMINTYNSAEGMAQEGWSDPNYLGCALGFGMVVSVREILNGTKNKWIFVLTIISGVIAMLGLASRGMILALGVTIACLLFFSNVKMRFKIILIMCIAAFIVLLYNNQYFDFLLARFESDDGTGSHRTEIWATKISCFITEGNLFNWLVGFGQESGFKLGFSSGRSTHNDFVSILVDYGFLGIFLFLKVVISSLKACSNKIRPQIVALWTYIFFSGMSIEPLSTGNIASLGFIFYITQLVRYSRQIKFEK